MLAKELSFGADARQLMLKGLNKLTQAVAVTMGPCGRNVAIQKPYQDPVVTKDGVSVAREVTFKDHFENLGAQLVKSVASKTADEAGDGTTTATVLTQAIFSEGLKAVVAGLNPIEIKRGIDKAVTAAVNALKDHSIPCEDDKSIEQVGTISANSERSIGKLLSQAISKVGHNGLITVEEGSGVEDELDVVDGLQVDVGYLSPYFSNNKQKMITEFEDALVLIVNKKLHNVRELLPVLEPVAQANKSLLVVAEDIDGDALASLIVNSARGIVNVCAIKAPGFGNNQKETLQDIAVLTGTMVLEADLEPSLDKITIDQLGTVKRLVVTKDKTTFINGGGTSDAIQTRIFQLKDEFEHSENEHEKNKLKERIAKLSGGVAVIKVGAATEVEMKEKKDRVEDALNATTAAIEEGVVAGGGVALLRALEATTGLKGDNESQSMGISILHRALEAPLRQIVANAGDEPSVVIQKVIDGKKNFGYNASNKKYGDMVKFGIIDPTKVTRTALQKAASVAGLMLTTECLIVQLPEKEDK